MIKTLSVLSINLKVEIRLHVVVLNQNMHQFAFMRGHELILFCIIILINSHNSFVMLYLELSIQLILHHAIYMTSH